MLQILLLHFAPDSTNERRLQSFYGSRQYPNPEVFGRLSDCFKYSLLYRMLVCHVNLSTSSLMSSARQRGKPISRLLLWPNLSASNLIIAQQVGMDILVRIHSLDMGDGAASSFETTWLTSLTLQCVSSVQWN